MNKEIVEVGFLNGDDYIINVSSIKSELLRQLKFVDDYLSDILFDLNKFDMMIKEKKEGVLWFGFRKCGVDHKEYIASNLKDEYRKYHYYSKIYRLEIKIEGDKMIATLAEKDGTDFIKEVND